MFDRRQVLTTAILAASAATAPACATPGPDLTGKSVLITGASSGFGNLAALHFARSGATVIASMRNMAGGARPEAKALAETAAREKLRLHLVEIDVTDPEQVVKGVAEAEGMAGGALDCVFANAGIAMSAPVELLTDADTRLEFETNLFGCLATARAALPRMRQAKRGLVVPVSSQLGRMIIPGNGTYSGSKFALEAMFEALAYELAPFGVEVTIVQPGGYPTRIWDNGRVLSEAAWARTDAERARAYVDQLAMLQRRRTGGTTDPMDVPRAVAELIAMPAGTRPLRRPVHPNTRGTDAINACSAEVQAAVLGSGPYAAWHKAVAG